MAPLAAARSIARCFAARSGNPRAYACLRNAIAVAVLAAFCASLIDIGPASAQSRGIFQFPTRPKTGTGQGLNLQGGRPKDATGQMLVRADEINYDYTNERVAAVGNVQIYYGESSLEADKVIYDQKTKRLHAEGNVRLAEADGKITYGEIIDLSDDFRDGFVDSLRIDMPDETRFAATRADRSAGNYTVFQNGVYTACEPCKDDPKKPPKWQVKAARVIHDQGEKMMYFEDATLEFFGVPVAWMPFFSAPDPTAKRKSGFLVPGASSSNNYGFAISTPYYFALAPDYDATITPMITTRQGPLLKGEWRQRLIDGSYAIRASGIFQLDRQAFVSSGDLPGDRDFRGHIQSEGQFRLNDKWVWGWNGTAITDKAYFQDYGMYKSTQGANLLASTPDYVLSQAYLQGRGDRSFFDMRAMYFYGFASTDDQKQIPVVHPVINYDYTVKPSVFGGELSFRGNLTSLSRESADFDPINALAAVGGLCTITSADPAARTPNNCLLRGVPGIYTRLSGEATWRRTFIDPYGQVFTPFATMRADVADVQVKADPGVSNFMPTGSDDVARAMPTVGLEYRYPFISVQSWGTQTIEPIAQILLRPNETGIDKLPNEDSQSLIFDTTNLFRVDKFAGWDRVEGGSRANAGVSYTAQFNHGGYVNMMFGQSYSLFGQNSFAVPSPTNTGISSGLDTARSDYVASATYQPNSTLMFSSQFRFNEANLGLQRTELQGTVNFDRWSSSITYGNYAAQPDIGLLDRREGVLATGRVKVTPNWQMLGGVMYDLRAAQVAQTNIGVGYIDDCLILALNYITEYAYNSTTTYNHTVMFQLSLRTLGGNTVSQGLSTPSGGGLPFH
jgi:LPS-assembly protein